MPWLSFLNHYSTVLFSTSPSYNFTIQAYNPPHLFQCPSRFIILLKQTVNRLRKKLSLSINYTSWTDNTTTMFSTSIFKRLNSLFWDLLCTLIQKIDFNLEHSHRIKIHSNLSALYVIYHIPSPLILDLDLNFKTCYHGCILL